MTTSPRIALAVLCVLSIQLNAQTPQPAPLDRLRDNIVQIAKGVDTTWGIYLKCIETGEEIAINADQQMDTMSVIKLPLMVEAFRQIEAGKFSLTDRYTLKAGDRRPGTGVLRSLDDGAAVTIKDLLTLMTIVSDNTATDIIFDKVGGPEPVNALMRSFGFNSIQAVGNADVWFKALAAAPNSTVFHNDVKKPFGLSSPRDMGKLLEKIALGQAVSKQASSQMLDILNRQVYSSRIPKYVVGYQTPHKTGDMVPFVANDVGLLLSEKRRIVVSIFTNKGDMPNGVPTKLVGPAIEDAIGRIAEHAADYFAFRSQ
jgi:beta-lactamase class A